MKVAVIMGSDSDYNVVKDTLIVLKKFNVEFTVNVMSAHRTPFETIEFAKNAEDNGYDLIIGAAGKAAHLPGVMAAVTILPVIGIPIKSSTMDGLDSLLSMVQMPSGIPVATVAINGAKNAALLAVQILSLKDEKLKEKLKEYKKEMKLEVIKKDEKLQKMIREEL